MLTPWFPKHIKPARPGCYEVDFNSREDDPTREYQYWTGENWYYGEQWPTDDWPRSVPVPPLFHRSWRGLTNEA